MVVSEPLIENLAQQAHGSTLFIVPCTHGAWGKNIERTYQEVKFMSMNESSAKSQAGSDFCYQLIIVKYSVFNTCFLLVICTEVISSAKNTIKLTISYLVARFGLLEDCLTPSNTQIITLMYKKITTTNCNWILFFLAGKPLKWLVLYVGTQQLAKRSTIKRKENR